MTTLSETSSPAAGPSLEGTTAPAHHLKRSKCTLQTTALTGSPWRYVRVWVDGKAKLRPFRCPDCGTEIRLLANHDKTVQQKDAITCGKCGWIPALMTQAQKDELIEDPEQILVKEHMKRMEEKDNKHHINGKSKRNRKAISAACY
jgi:ribosomal protein S27AE